MLFRSHRPTRLDPYPGTTAGLARLRMRVPIALVTDGAVAVQRSKVAALGLGDAFDAVVYSDALGRAHRKPAPLPFRRALATVRARPERSVHIGDRVATDVVGAHGVGMQAVRVRTGEYTNDPDAPGTRASVDDAVTAIGLIERWLE